MKQFWNWLVISSADPETISLSVRGIIGGILTAITILLGLANIHVASDQVTIAVDATVKLVQAIAAFISAYAFLYGIIRKIYLTATGQNPTPLLG